MKTIVVRKTNKLTYGYLLFGAFTAVLLLGQALYKDRSIVTELLPLLLFIPLLAWSLYRPAKLTITEEGLFDRKQPLYNWSSIKQLNFSFPGRGRGYFLLTAVFPGQEKNKEWTIANYEGPYATELWELLHEWQAAGCLTNVELVSQNPERLPKPS